MSLISSRKQKARRLQNFVAGVFLFLGKYISNGPFPSDQDIYPRQMGGAGVDIVFSPFAQQSFPFDIECKNVEKLNIVEAYNEHVQKHKESKNIKFLVHSKNKSDVLVTIAFDDFLKLLNMHPSVPIDDITARVDANKNSWEAIVREFKVVGD